MHLELYCKVKGSEMGLAGIFFFFLSAAGLLELVILTAVLAIRRSAFPGGLCGRGGSSLVQTSQAGLLPIATSLLRLLIWVPHPRSPKFFVSPILASW